MQVIYASCMTPTEMNNTLLVRSLLVYDSSDEPWKGDKDKYQRW